MTENLSRCQLSVNKRRSGHLPSKLAQLLDGIFGDGTIVAMGSKRTAEQFIYDCFRERTAALKQELEIHRAYRRKFCRDECHWNSRRGVIERSEAEKIVSVSSSDDGVGVVTTGSGIYRSRYHVKPSGEDWLIHNVDMECGLCRVKGIDPECVMCAGEGWLDAKHQASYLERGRSAAFARSSLSEEELGDRQYHNQAIEQFMADHFRENITARKKEVEIHSPYRARFYSPECDWDSNKKAIQWCEAERIVNIIPIDTGAHVITEGFSPLPLRYHLRPEGQSWLIWEVDTKCPNCSLRGKSADCFLCDGTGWHNGRGKGGDGGGQPPGEETPPKDPRF